MERYAIERVRHETKRRTLTVDTITRLNAKMLRINLVGDLDDFVSLSPDDHIKLFFPGDTVAMRDFTPRRFDIGAGTMVVDFALHDAGAATGWATGATVGDTLEIGGPRGSAIIPADFDWYWLVGDETALPAIGRWLEAAAPGLTIDTFVAVDGPEAALEIETHADWTPVWAARDGGMDDAVLLQAAMAQRDMPPGDGFVWIAAEAGVARSVRAYILDERGHRREWIKAAGYWSRGKADVHERIED